MPLVTGRQLIQAVLRWELQRSNSPFEPTRQADDEGFSYAPDAAVLNHVFLASYTIAAAGSQVVDFRTFTNLAGEAVVGTKIGGVYVRVAPGTGVLKVEPDATDGLQWPFVAAAPAYTLKPSAAQEAGWLHCDGTNGVLDATHKEWLLSATAATVSVTLAAFVGT